MALHPSPNNRRNTLKAWTPASLISEAPRARVEEAVLPGWWLHTGQGQPGEKLRRKPHLGVPCSSYSPPLVGGEARVPGWGRGGACFGDCHWPPQAGMSSGSPPVSPT